MSARLGRRPGDPSTHRSAARSMGMSRGGGPRGYVDDDDGDRTRPARSSNSLTPSRKRPPKARIWAMFDPGLGGTSKIGDAAKGGAGKTECRQIASLERPIPRLKRPFSDDLPRCSSFGPAIRDLQNRHPQRASRVAGADVRRTHAHTRTPPARPGSGFARMYSRPLSTLLLCGRRPVEPGI